MCCVQIEHLIINTALLQFRYRDLYNIFVSLQLRGGERFCRIKFASIAVPLTGERQNLSPHAQTV